MIDPTASICFGNRELGGRTPIGAIYYTAFYNIAFTDEEIARNVARLQASDDR